MRPRRDGRAPIPVYPTLSPWTVWRPSCAAWRGTYPFADPSGRWAFSGRVALFESLPLLRLPPGSTVLVPNYHQGVEIETWLAAGHRLRYYRVDDRLQVDLDDVARRMDDSVSALHLIHYFGFAQPLEPVARFCRERGLRLIEDCALSLFSRDPEGTWLGSRGDLAIFSVYKTVPLPHGGYSVTRERRPEPAPRLRRAPLKSTLVQTLDLVHEHLRASGWRHVERALTRTTRAVARRLSWSRGRTISSGGARWDGRMLGYDASAWIPVLLRGVEPATVVARRRANYERLAAHLRGRVAVPFPDLPSGCCPLFFPILVADKAAFREGLGARGIGSVNLWEDSHPTCPPELALEVAAWRRGCVELPIHQDLSARDVDRVAEAVLEIVQEGAQ